MVEVNVKPLIDSIMDLEILITDLLWGESLLQGLSFCGSSIFIRSTDI